MTRFRPFGAGGFDHARHLRRDATEAEKALWRVLRNRGFEGLKFRRQVPVGSYIADFLCESENLIVEVDGGQHDTQMAYDEARTRYLQSQGFRVVRFWNNDVLRNIEGVLEDMRQLLQHPLPRERKGPVAQRREGEGLHGGYRESPSPQPSPEGEGVDPVQAVKT